MKDFLCNVMDHSPTSPQTSQSLSCVKLQAHLFKYDPPWNRIFLVRTDVVAAGVAVLGVERLEAGAAVWPALLHDVALAPQHRLALEAAEVLHVPVASLRLCALVGKDDLRGRWIIYHGVLDLFV